MQDELRLTPTSYIVLGLLAWAGESTPYRLKQIVAASVGNFWTLQHAQLYTETERLAQAGYVTETRERGGRRRKLYTITDKGRDALDRWRNEPTGEIGELRHPGVLKLFFGADPAVLGPLQLESHRAKLAEYEQLRDELPPEVPHGVRLALESGIAFERQQIAWWKQVMVPGDGDSG